MIQKLLTISIVPLLLASTNLKLTEENIQNNRDYYEVIGATTGKKIEDKLYAKERVIETHITAVSSIKKALLNEGIDPANIRFLLYYDGLTISDSSPPRMWQRKYHPDTISSPWLDLTKTVTTSGEIKITIRIDATVARLLSDLYSEPEDRYDMGGFLSISTIKQGCYSNIFIKRRIALLKLVGYSFPPLDQDYKEAEKESLKSFNCIPEEIRKPFKSALRSSKPVGIGIIDGASRYAVADHLFLHCQDEAEEYYSQLYPQLAIQGLKILENKSNVHPEWWSEIIERIKPQKS